MTEDRRDFEETWKSIVERGEADDRERRRNFWRVFEAGGADKQETKRHYANAVYALLRADHYETAAVLMRGLGVREEEILDTFKAHHLRCGLSAHCLWDAAHNSNIQPDARAIVAALNEVSEHYQDFDDLPF